MRYKCIVAYDGNNYVGFQSQINGIAIQDVIEKTLFKIFGEEIRIIMASRTDSGVHAYGQVFHFDSLKDKDLRKLKYSLNSLLPKDIHISKVEISSDDFHARFNVKSKKYKYLINYGEYDVFKKGYAYQCGYDLDVELMREACKLFLGKHDFGTFNTTSYELVPNQVREIYSLDIIEDGKNLTVEIIGDGFLRNMVRMIVGTLIDLGRGQKNIDVVKHMIDNPSKTTNRYNIDPNGLYLVEIYY